MERDDQERVEQLVDLGAASTETHGGIGNASELSQVGRISGLSNE